MAAEGVDDVVAEGAGGVGVFRVVGAVVAVVVGAVEADAVEDGGCARCDIAEGRIVRREGVGGEGGEVIRYQRTERWRKVAVVIEAVEVDGERGGGEAAVEEVEVLGADVGVGQRGGEGGIGACDVGEVGGGLGGAGGGEELGGGGVGGGGDGRDCCGVGAEGAERVEADHGAEGEEAGVAEEGAGEVVGGGEVVHAPALEGADEAGVDGVFVEQFGDEGMELRPGVGWERGGELVQGLAGEGGDADGGEVGVGEGAFGFEGAGEEEGVADVLERFGRTAGGGVEERDVAEEGGEFSFGVERGTPGGGGNGLADADAPVDAGEGEAGGAGHVERALVGRADGGEGAEVVGGEGKLAGEAGGPAVFGGGVDDEGGGLSDGDGGVSGRIDDAAGVEIFRADRFVALLDGRDFLVEQVIGDALPEEAGGDQCSQQSYPDHARLPPRTGPSARQ